MTTQQQNIVQTLNDLLQRSRDSEQGFRTCAEGVQNSSIREQLQSEARRCRECTAELETKVRNLGGEPSQSGTTSSSGRRAWANIKTTIIGMNDNSVLAECENEENNARNAYEEALQKDMPADVKNLIERQYQSIKQGRIRNLRNTTT